jgi:outer membrane protein OmpA-like peptidoglycan-associated protein
MTMSEFVGVPRLALPPLLGALLIIGSGLSSTDTAAASLGQRTSSSALSTIFLAQNAGQDGAPAVLGQPDAGPPGSAASVPAAEDVPFSELNEALAAARARLAELTKAAEIAKVAGELRENLQSVEAENRQLKAVLSQLQTDHNTLQTVNQAAEQRIAELERVAAGSSAETSRLADELAALRQENSQLSEDLSLAQTSASENATELAKAREAFDAREESLTAATEESASEIARLQRELDAARERVLVAERDKAAGTTELIELRKLNEDNTADNARLAEDLDGTITELANVRADLGATKEELENANLALEGVEQEAGVLREQLTSTRTEAGQLRGRLERTEADLNRMRTLNAGLEQQVDVLKVAAGEATDAARQNLLAVEDQINEINAALASVKAEEFLSILDEEEESTQPLSPATVLNGATGTAEPASTGWVPRPSPPRADIASEPVSATPSNGALAPTARNLILSGTGRLGLPIEPAVDDGEAAPSPSQASLATGLPEAERQDAEALLSQLKASEDDRGLSMTVPGELLFTVDSEEIEPAAFDMLTDVARLVDLYDERNILIVGHTDAVGDAVYNQDLSERRAALVKEFFVEQFQINESRLQIEGKGEQEPISSNATVDGRKANRRVEVVILN